MTWRKSLTVALVGALLTFGSVPTLARRSVLVSDTFTDTNSTDLEAHTIAPTAGGTSWTETGVCEFDIQSNKAAWAGAFTFCGAYVEASDTSVALQVDIAVPNASDYAYGFVVRLADGANYWVVDVARSSSGTPELRIFDYVAGSFNAVCDSDTVAAISGTTVTLKATTNGNTIEGYLGGVLTATCSSATFNNTETKHGLFIYSGFDTSGTFDDFSIDSEPGGGGTPSFIPPIINAPVRGGGHIKVRHQ